MRVSYTTHTFGGWNLYKQQFEDTFFLQLIVEAYIGPLKARRT